MCLENCIPSLLHVLGSAQFSWPRQEWGPLCVLPLVRPHRKETPTEGGKRNGRCRGRRGGHIAEDLSPKMVVLLFPALNVVPLLTVVHHGSPILLVPAVFNRSLIFSYPSLFFSLPSFFPSLILLYSPSLFSFFILLFMFSSFQLASVVQHRNPRGQKDDVHGGRMSRATLPPCDRCGTGCNGDQWPIPEMGWVKPSRV